MNFTSLLFWKTLLLGIGCIILLKFFLKHTPWKDGADRYLLAILSLTLFGLESTLSLGILIYVILITYLALWVLPKVSGIVKALLVSLFIPLQIAPLLLYKYRDFIAENLGLPEPTSESFLATTLIPLGISFYTFQLVGLVIDNLREKSGGIYSLDLINFASFFPQVVAGPIERKHDLLPQLAKFRFQTSWIDLEAGTRLIILGLFQKLVIADNLAQTTMWINASQTSPWLVHIANVAFGLRIYFDFCGYSFIAVGLARLMGVTLSLNFDAPYCRKNIQDFWRSWHRTLTFWFRDYLYIPLGGNRVVYTGLLVIFVFGVSGLWHGAGWNFIFWGLFHGLLLALFQKIKGRLPMPFWAAWVVTTIFVATSWLFFYETNAELLGAKCLLLLDLSAYLHFPVLELRQNLGSLGEVTYLLGSLAIALLAVTLEFLSLRKMQLAYGLFNSDIVQMAMILALVFLTPQADNGFIYFNF